MNSHWRHVQNMHMFADICREFDRTQSESLQNKKEWKEIIYSYINLRKQWNWRYVLHLYSALSFHSCGAFARTLDSLSLQSDAAPSLRGCICSRSDVAHLLAAWTQIVPSVSLSPGAKRLAEKIWRGEACNLPRINCSCFKIKSSRDGVNKAWCPGDEQVVHISDLAGHLKRSLKSL